MTTDNPRRGRGRQLTVTAAAAAAALALAACSGSSTDGGNGGANTSSRAKTLIIAENEVPASFDPIQSDNSTVDEVTLPAYDTLVKFDDAGKIAPDLATAWQIAANGKSITMTLRSDVTFHDGTKLTTSDVKYTLDRIRKINIGVASFVTAYSSTTVTDPTHLTINLSSPSGPFLSFLCRIYVVNSALVKKNAGSDDGQKWLSTHDAGSGPYELQGYTPNQAADFTQYPKYWQGWSGQASKVEFKYMSDAATERSSLLNSDVDLAMDINPNDWTSFSSNSTYVVNKANTNVVLYAFFKMSGGPTSNKLLREAIAYSYNYQQHISNILKGAGQKAVGVLPSGMQCFDPSVTQPTFDLVKAKSLLAQSGLKNVTITMTYLKATAEMEQAAALLQSNLKQVGVNLKLQAITYPQYADEAKSNSTTPDLGMIYAFPAISDADSIMYQNFDSKFINGGQNWGGYKNPTVDSLVEKAQQLTDLTQRCSLYNQAENLVVNDYPTINLANSQYVTIYNKRLSGYTYEPSHHQTVDVYRIKVS
ncbi:MAG: transporter substrate-binding protein [Pseudonocardiales bacterium]|nr:transporter substrate-binding protein [Pseudonocardiales bacterium]